MSAEAAVKTTQEDALGMCSYIKNLDVTDIWLFGSVARVGRGNDLDIVVEVQPDIYAAYTDKRQKTLLFYGDYFMTSFREYALKRAALGIAHAELPDHMGNPDYPEELGYVDAFLVPEGWQEPDTAEAIIADYKIRDPCFVRNVAADALLFSGVGFVKAG